MPETSSEPLCCLSVPDIWGTLTSRRGLERAGFRREDISVKQERGEICEEDSDISKCKRRVMQKESPSFTSEIPTWGLLSSAEHTGHTVLSSSISEQLSFTSLGCGSHPFIQVLHYKHLNGKGCCRHSLLNLFPATTRFLALFLAHFLALKGQKIKLPCISPKRISNNCKSVKST